MKTMIDFHIHSYFSDGDQTPEEILRVATRRKLSAIAITDHCDNSGRFMYLPSVTEPRPLREYIAEIRNLPPNESVKVFIGLEICDFSANTPYPTEFSDFDFLLIETFPAQSPNYKTFDPIEKVGELKKKYSFPVGLAHPTLQDIEQNIDFFDQNDIFIELNSEKLLLPPKNQEKILRRTAELLNSTSKLQISVGSDAHVIFLIGAVKPIWEFIIKNDFLDRIILIQK